MKEINQIWETYRSCWSDNDTLNRTSVLKEITAEDFEYRDPNVELSGSDQLSDYMSKFQDESGGASFDVVDLSIHHDRSLAKWNMVNAQQQVLGSGESFALYEDGKLKQVTGFFKSN